jgi:hypothetical protein
MWLKFIPELRAEMIVGCVGSLPLSEQNIEAYFSIASIFQSGVY